MQLFNSDILIVDLMHVKIRNNLNSICVVATQEDLCISFVPQLTVALHAKVPIPR